MVRKKFYGALLLSLSLVAVACGDDASMGSGTASDTDAGTGGAGTDGSGGFELLSCNDVVSEADRLACTPNSNDYQPGGEDSWDACVTDDGAYHLLADTPSSVARVEAYGRIMDVIGVAAPTADDFTEARTIYAEEEGLESRLQRREDLHHPPVPEADWDPGVDSDKQCTVDANVEKYPQRCVGPALIGPLINDAFVAGQMEQGDALVHAARIDAAMLWFYYLSVYKEANTCFTSKAKDCDSAWAYYTGGFDRAGGIALSAQVKAASPDAHEAIWDGISAYRCLRDLNPADDSPEVSDLNDAAQQQLCHGNAQLDTALVFGMAQVVKDRLTTLASATAEDAVTQWAFLQVLGPVLAFEADRRDPAQAAILDQLWAMDAASAAEIDGGMAAIDALFPCA